MARARKAGVSKDDLEKFNDSTDTKSPSDAGIISDLFISVRDLKTILDSAPDEKYVSHAKKSFDAYSLSYLIKDLPPQSQGAVRVIDIRFRAGDSDENRRFLETVRQEAPNVCIEDTLGAALNSAPTKSTLYFDFGTTRQLWSNTLCLPGGFPQEISHNKALIFRTPIRYQSGTVPGPTFATLYDTVGVMGQVGVGCLVVHVSPLDAHDDEDIAHYRLDEIVPKAPFAPLQAFAEPSLVVLFKYIFILCVPRQISNLIHNYDAQHHSSRLELLYSGTASPRDIVHELRHCWEFTDYGSSLIAMGNAMIQSLEHSINTTPIDYQSKSLGDAEFAWKEYFLSRRTELTLISSRLKACYESHSLAWNSYQQIQSIRASEGVTRLTVLAAVFLPLSLASSMLAMEHRLTDLHLRLFDFVGIFFVLSSLAFVAYLLISGFWQLSRKVEEVWNKAKFSLGKSMPIEHARNGKPDPRLFWSRLLWGAFISCFVLFWLVITIAFVVGMVYDVVVGMKILGIAVACWVFVVGILVLSLFLFYIDDVKMIWRLRHERVERTR